MSDRTILVVDDERKIRQLVRGYLEKEGFTVIEETQRLIRETPAVNTTVRMR